MADIDSDVSLVICTKDRVEELTRLLKSILRQDPLPAEVIVVDDGHLAEVPHSQGLKEAGVAVIYQRKPSPGICRSRNLGARLASGSLVMYLDDDTILQPGYISVMSRLFRERPEIMGARGYSETIDGPATRRNQAAWQALERFFLLKGTGHRILPSGFCNPTWAQFSVATEVPFLTGCTTYRKQVFKTIQYDEALEELGPYAFGEDLAFSYRVGRTLGPLVYLPSACLKHIRATHPRMAPAKLARLRLHNQYFIYRDCFRPEPANPLAFAWALTGKTVLAALGFLLRPGRTSWQVLLGTLDGVTLVSRMAMGLSPVPRPAHRPAAQEPAHDPR